MHRLKKDLSIFKSAMRSTIVLIHQVLSSCISHSPRAYCPYMRCVPLQTRCCEPSYLCIRGSSAVARHRVSIFPVDLQICRGDLPVQTDRCVRSTSNDRKAPPPILGVEAPLLLLDQNEHCALSLAWPSHPKVLVARLQAHRAYIAYPRRRRKL